MDIRINKKYCYNIFICAFFCRLMVFLFVLLTIGVSGFYGSENLNDDWRFETGAEYYSQYAIQIFDVKAFAKAFASVDDETGYKFAQKAISTTPFWYWLVCILVYITKTRLAIRLMNILFASLAVVYVYKFARLIFKEKSARLASGLLAYLPYPVIFSCFAYKDQMIMFCTFFLLYVSTKYRHNLKINIYEYILAFLTSFAAFFTRGGLSSILIAICWIIAFSSKIKFRMKSIFPLIVIILLLIFAIYAGVYETIIFKYTSYVINRAAQNEGGFIKFITINKIGDFYKLPILFPFSILMPFYTDTNLDSWPKLMSCLNVFAVPISIGATFYIIGKNKKNKLVIYSCLIYYVISIVASIGIFRHYYSLIPIPYMFFSEFLYTSKNKAIVAWFIASLLLFLLIIIYHFFKVF